MDEESTRMGFLSRISKGEEGKGRKGKEREKGKWKPEKEE